MNNLCGKLLWLLTYVSTNYIKYKSNEHTNVPFAGDDVGFTIGATSGFVASVPNFDGLFTFSFCAQFDINSNASTPKP